MKTLSRHILESFVNEAKQSSPFVDSTKINKTYILKRKDGSGNMNVPFVYPEQFKNGQSSIDAEYLKNQIGKEKIDSFSWISQHGEKKLFDVILKNGEKRQIYSNIIFNENKPDEMKIIIHITEPLNLQSEIDLTTLSQHLKQFNKRIGNYDIHNNVTDTGNGRYEIEVTANGKRGIPADAQKIAMQNQPTLPPGFKYKTVFAYHDSGRTKMSHNNLSTDNYTDSEFSGSATFIAVKK